VPWFDNNKHTRSPAEALNVRWRNAVLPKHWNMHLKNLVFPKGWDMQLKNAVLPKHWNMHLSKVILLKHWNLHLENLLFCSFESERQVTCYIREGQTQHLGGVCIFHNGVHCVYFVISVFIVCCISILCSTSQWISNVRIYLIISQVHLGFRSKVLSGVL